jgi:hypothetical protein
MQPACIIAGRFSDIENLCAESKLSLRSRMAVFRLHGDFSTAFKLCELVNLRGGDRVKL